MLNGATAVAWPVSVPVPMFLTTNVWSADESTATVPKSCGGRRHVDRRLRRLAERPQQRGAVGERGACGS